MLPTIEGTGGHANGVVIFNDTTYVSGSSSRPFPYSQVAVLWKNGQLIELENPNNNRLISISSSIALGNNGDVVVVGAVTEDIVGPSPFMPTPAYWNNEKLSMLLLTPGCSSEDDHNNCYRGAIATGAAFSGNDLYIAGFAAYRTEADDYLVPVTWKNGVFSALPMEENFGAVGQYKVQVSGNDVYVFGNLSSEDTGTLPVYWKNGQLRWISQETSEVMDGAIDNGVPYSVGYFYNAQGFRNPGFWRDTELSALSMYDPKLIGEAVAIEYFSGDQYITGQNFYQPDPNDNHLYSKPAIWVNGARTDLDVPPPAGCCRTNPMFDYPQPDSWWPSLTPYINSRKPSAPRIPVATNAISRAVPTDIAVGWR